MHHRELFGFPFRFREKVLEYVKKFYSVHGKVHVDMVKFFEFVIEGGDEVLVIPFSGYLSGTIVETHHAVVHLVYF